MVCSLLLLLLLRIPRHTLEVWDHGLKNRGGYRGELGQSQLPSVEIWRDGEYR